VVGGNERVVRPRLADAKFFFDQDRKRTLESRVPGLAKVVYHNKLGTAGERIERVRAIAKVIGAQLGSDHLAHEADTAARLAKADLLTDMVGEFPELQGIMGGYYAAHDGESADIAQAIEDRYKPRFAGDAAALRWHGVALADKLGAGRPVRDRSAAHGDKAPVRASRRHALGIVRMLMEKTRPASTTWWRSAWLVPAGCWRNGSARPLHLRTAVRSLRERVQRT
jgi:glycyl-tRNA synthetase beta chain